MSFGARPTTEELGRGGRAHGAFVAAIAAVVQQAAAISSSLRRSKKSCFLACSQPKHA
jgi:hypothetical protein